MPPSEPEQTVLSDVAALKALAHPLRMGLLVELGRSDRTVKELAELLGVQPTRLYHHIKMLEGAGLIAVASTRMVSGIEERTYRANGQSWTPAPELTGSLVEEGVVRALFDMVRSEVELAMTDRPVAPGDPDSAVALFSLTDITIAPQEVDELQERVFAVLEDYREDRDLPPGARRHNVLMVGYVAPGGLRGPDAP